MNMHSCECGMDFDQKEMQEHLVSIEHRDYVCMKKMLIEALSKPVQTGLAS